MIQKEREMESEKELKIGRKSDKKSKWTKKE